MKCSAGGPSSQGLRAASRTEGRRESSPALPGRPTEGGTHWASRSLSSVAENATGTPLCALLHARGLCLRVYIRSTNNATCLCRLVMEVTCPGPQQSKATLWPQAVDTRHPRAVYVPPRTCCLPRRAFTQHPQPDPLHLQSLSGLQPAFPALERCLKLLSSYTFPELQPQFLHAITPGERQGRSANSSERPALTPESAWARDARAAWEARHGLPASSSSRWCGERNTTGIRPQTRAYAATLSQHPGSPNLWSLSTPPKPPGLTLPMGSRTLNPGWGSGIQPCSLRPSHEDTQPQWAQLQHPCCP